MTDITIAVAIKMIDEDELRKSAIDYGCGDNEDIEEMIEQLIVSPDEAPLDHGYEIKSIDVAPTSDNEFNILITVDVYDEQAMTKEARNCYSAVVGDNDWKPASLGEAAYELLCASNERPSPDLLGFAFAGHKYLVDQAIDPDTIQLEEKFSTPGI